MNCIKDDCPRRANKERLCDPHREDLNQSRGNLCEYPPCERGALKRSLCSSHYSQKRRGDTLSDLPETRKEHAPKGQDGLPVHGTSARYRSGCRCPDCKECRAAENNRAIAVHKAKYGVAPSSRYRRRIKDTLGYWPQGGSDFYIPHSERVGVYERDGRVCQLCGGPIPKDLDPNNPEAPTLDHIIPQSWTLIPDHSPSNLQAAHRGCNSRKRDRSITLDATV